MNTKTEKNVSEEDEFRNNPWCQDEINVTDQHGTYRQWWFRDMQGEKSLSIDSHEEKEKGRLQEVTFLVLSCTIG